MTDPEVAGPTTGARALPFAAFCAVLATEVDPVFATAPPPTSRLWLDLGLDELALCRLHLAVEDLNPHFRLPDQADADLMTIGDIHHYYATMEAEHVGGARS
ncbi:MAG TPA: hypothetical protein VGO60_12565 [Iamia sp.]|nr:hypothetical protein [Iamia sp.]